MSLERPQVPESAHENVAPTAIGVAYRRSLAEIPYAKEIFEELETEAHTHSEDVNRLKDSQLAPIIEARYRLVSRLAKETKAKQFLELAAGYASRGLEFTEDPAVGYVEFDLRSVVERKQRIIHALEKDRGNLQFAGGNALDLDALASAVGEFDPKQPLTVLNEGLLRYLSFDEKAEVARNVHSLLEQFGGAWITPDITLKSVIAMENKKSPGVKEALSAVAGMNVDENAFESVAAAEKFFSEIGFSVEKHSFMEVSDELVTPQKLGMSREAAEEELRDAVVFVMKPL